MSDRPYHGATSRSFLVWRWGYYYRGLGLTFPIPFRLSDRKWGVSSNNALRIYHSNDVWLSWGRCWAWSIKYCGAFWCLTIFGAWYNSWARCWTWSILWDILLPHHFWSLIQFLSPLKWIRNNRGSSCSFLRQWVASMTPYFCTKLEYFFYTCSKHKAIWHSGEIKLHTLVV